MYTHEIKEFESVIYLINLQQITNNKILDCDLVSNNFLIHFNKIFNELNFIILRTNPSNTLNIINQIIPNFLPINYDPRRVKTSLMKDNGDKVFSMYSNKSQLLQTDGASKNCPQIVIMGALEVSDYGGESVIVDVEKVYDYFFSKYGTQILDDSVLQIDSMIQNQNTKKHKVNLFEIENGIKKMYHITTIPKVSGTSFAIKLYKEVIHFVQDSKNQIHFQLKKGEILILKNTQVLHARNEFESGSVRSLQRVWIF
jgi:Taurine catabolism dioxygenase TauD, TfdA family